MIIKNDYLNQNRDYLEREKQGLDKAIQNFDKRYKNNEVDRSTFLKGLDDFSKKQIDLNKRIDKQSKK